MPRRSQRHRSQRQQRQQKRSQRHRSQRQQRQQKRSQRQRGGSPAYRLHQADGLLNTVNPHAHSNPLTYIADDVVENHSNQYQVSH